MFQQTGSRELGTAMQLAMKSSEGKPGPKYLLRSSVNEVSGGVISEACPKSDVEWEIYRAKQLPGLSVFEMKALWPFLLLSFVLLFVQRLIITCGTYDLVRSWRIQP